MPSPRHRRRRFPRASLSRPCALAVGDDDDAAPLVRARPPSVSLRFFLYHYVLLFYNVICRASLALLTATRVLGTAGRPGSVSRPPIVVIALFAIGSQRPRHLSRHSLPMPPAVLWQCAALQDGRRAVGSGSRVREATTQARCIQQFPRPPTVSLSLPTLSPSPSTPAPLCSLSPSLRMIDSR